MSSFSDRKPAKFSGEIEEWRVWKIKFRGWLRTDGVLKVVSNAEDIFKKVNDMTGYDAVTAALKPRVDEEREVQGTIGYYLPWSQHQLGPS